MGVQTSLPVVRQDHLIFPPEILEQIIRDFTPRDILIARQVCVGWKHYVDSILQTKCQENLNFVVEDTEERTRWLIERSEYIVWNAYAYKSVLLTKHSLSFWDDYGETITKLEFYDCTFPTSDFDLSNDASIQIRCPNLRHLSIRNCGKYLMMGKSYFHLHKYFNMKNLISLDVSQNSYLNDYALTSLLRETVTLESLNISDTKMTFTKAVFNRFYPSLAEKPSADGFEFSDCILTFHAMYLVFLSTQKAANMTKIIMDDTRMDSKSLSLINSFTSFHWKLAGFNNCIELKSQDLKEFLTQQKNLKHLEIGRTKADFVSFLNEIDHLKDLQHLVLRENHGLSTGEFVQHMKYLQSLDISYCSGLPLTTFELPQLNELRELRMRSIVPPNVIASAPAITAKLISLTSRLGRLRELDLGCCGSVVTDEVLQSIITNIRSLEVLKLCQSKITDKGTAGVDSAHGPRLLSSPYSIALKQAQVKLEEPVSSCKTTLDTLRCLKHLSVSGCRDLGDATWSLAMRLPSLLSLDISSCSQISINGFQAIIRNCPSLEELNFLHCGTHITGNYDLLYEIKSNSLRLRKLVY